MRDAGACDGRTHAPSFLECVVERAVAVDLADEHVTLRLRGEMGVYTSALVSVTLMIER